MENVNAARVAELDALLGVARVDALVAMLAEQLQALPATDRRHLGASLHRMRGGAASLGFDHLAERLQSAQAACEGGSRIDSRALAAAAPTLAQALATVRHGGENQ